uniref:Evasin n=1 Tax=Amblyomma parvum TaxID=251391 RepID=A0A023G098_AMBPA
MKLRVYHNLIALLCGYQLIDGFPTESTIDLYSDIDGALDYIYAATNDSSGEYVFNETQDICTILGLNTTLGPLPVGCSVVCLSEGNKTLPDGSQCIDISVEEATCMEYYETKICEIGSCIKGHCTNCGEKTCCKRLPIMTMSISNQSND